MNRPQLYMLIGVPASGKSTWINRRIFSIKGNTLIASTDDHIQTVADSLGKTYNEIFHEEIKNAEKKMYEKVMYATAHDWNIVWDQTNLNVKSRAKKLIMIPDHYEKIAVVFKTPEPEELKRRLESRPGKNIPMGVVENMIASLQMPQTEEGFDSIRDSLF